MGWGSEGWWGGEGWPVTTSGLEEPLDLGGTTGLPSPDGGIGSARLSSSLLERSSPRSCVSAPLREAPTALVPDYLFKGVSIARRPERSSPSRTAAGLFASVL